MQSSFQAQNTYTFNVNRHYEKPTYYKYISGIIFQMKYNFYYEFVCPSVGAMMKLIRFRNEISFNYKSERLWKYIMVEAFRASKNP